MTIYKVLFSSFSIRALPLIFIPLIFIFIFCFYKTYPMWEKFFKNLIRSFSKDNQITFKFLLITITIFLIWRTSFLQDDAFISFRYAKNFVSNGSLSWNFDDGPIVQGYTNFLWVVLSIFPIFLGLKIEIFVLLTGILFGSLTLLATYNISRLIFKRKIKSYAVITLLATNLSFLAFCTGGLETQLVTLLVTANWLFSLQLKCFYQEKELFTNQNKLQKNSQIEYLKCFSIGLFSLLAFITRIDSILITSPSILYSAYLIRKNNKGFNILKTLIIIIAPFMIGVFLYFNFAFNYYGDFLPNTYYVKTEFGGFDQIKLGILYISQFICIYGLLPIYLLTFLEKRNSKENELTNPKQFHHYFLLLSIFSYLLYIIKVGGDFMDFRFLIPILPIFYIFLVNFIFTKGMRIIATSLITLPIISMLNFRMPRNFSVESITQMRNHLYQKNENWIGIGKRLHEIFPTNKSSVVIGVTAAGAIPYFSELKTIDLLGLNDVYIAKKGLNIGKISGHTKGPSFDYLKKSKINLLIGHPQIRNINDEFDKEKFLKRYCWFLKGEECTKLKSSNPTFVTMRIDHEHTLDLIYFQRSEHIEKAINAGNLKFI